MADKLNTVEISPDDMLHHYGRIKAARRAKDKAVQEAQTERSRYTAVVKAAKKAGVDWEALELKERFEALGAEASRELLATTARYTAWDGNGEQLVMFGGLSDAPAAMPKASVAHDRARAKAWEVGFDHAKAGGAREDCSFALGTEMNQCWTAGYDDAAAGNAKADVDPGIVKASTARKLRTPGDEPAKVDKPAKAPKAAPVEAAAPVH